MRYLRKFNESTGQKMDFDTFKDIMSELSDYFECQFFDYSEDRENDPDYGGFYDCQVKIPFLDEYAIDDDNPFFNFDYLSYQNQMIPPFDDLSNINEIFEDDKVYRAINEQEEKLHKLKNNLDKIIENNGKIRKVFKTIQDEILPRFESFDNFLACDVGFESVESLLRVTFEIKK